MYLNLFSDSDSETQPKISEQNLSTTIISYPEHLFMY